MATNDLAVLGFGIDARGTESGAKKVHSVLDGIEAKANRIISTVKKLAGQVDAALKLANGTSGASRAEADVLKTQNKINQITATEQAKRESAEARHQQKLREIRDRNSGSLQNTLARETAQISAEQAKQQTGASRHQQKLAEIQARQTASITSEQAKQAASATAHQQKLIEIQARSVGSVQASQARQSAAYIAEQAKQTTAARSHQDRLAEIRARSDSSVGTIESRRLAQLSVLHAREQAAETRHQQRLVEIAARESANRQRALENVGGNLISGGAALTATVSAPLLGLAQKAVSSSVELDSSKRALTAIAGGADQAAKQLERLREIAKLPAIDFRGAIVGATRLQAVGFSAAQAERVLRQFANAIALTGGGAAQLDSVTIQLGQLSSKSKVLAQDLRPIIEAAPIVGRALKQAFGTVDSEAISKNLEAQGKSSKEFIEILLTELEKLPRVVSGPKETLENFAITVQIALAKVGDAILRILVPGLEFAANQIEKLANVFGNLPESAQKVIAAFISFAIVIGPLLVLIGSLIQSVLAMRTAYLLLQAAFAEGGALASLPALLSPAGPIILAVAAALAIATIAWSNYESAAQKAANVSNDALRSNVDAVQRNTELANTAKQVAEAQQINATESEKLKTVVSQLDPATRAYVSALKDQQKAAKETASATAALAQGSQTSLNANLSVLAQGALQSGGEIAKYQGHVKHLREEIEKLANGPAQISQAVLGPGGGASIVKASTLIRENSGALVQYESKLKDSQGALAGLGEKVAIIIDGLKLSREEFVKQQLAFGKTRNEVDALLGAYDAYKSQQGGVQNSTDNSTKSIDIQSKALKELGVALHNLDAQGLKSGIDQQIDELAKKAVKEGKHGVELRKLVAEGLKQQLPEQGGKTLGDAIKGKKELEAARKSIEGLSGLTVNTSSARKVEKDAKAVTDAILRQERELADGKVRLAKDSAERTIRQLQAVYDQGTISAAEFYGSKASLQSAGITDQIKLTELEIGQARKLYAATKQGSADRINAETELIRLRQKVIEQARTLVDVELDAAKAIKDANEKAVAALGDLSLAKNYEPPKIIDDVGRVADVVKKARVDLDALQNRISGKNQFGETYNRADLAEAQLRTQVAAVQKQINIGVLTETDGRKAILGLEAQHRDAIISSLQAQAEYEDLMGRVVEAERLRERIEDYKQLGTELTNTQRLLKGLGDTASIGDSFEQLGQDITGTMRSAFQAAFEQGPKGFFDALKSGFKKALAQLASDLLTSQFVRLLRNLLGGGSATSTGAGGGRTAGGQTGIAGAILNAATGGGSGGNGGGAGGGGGSAGYGGFTTPGIAGGNPAQSVLSAATGGRLPGISQYLSKIPILGKLFGPAASAAGSAGASTGASGAVAAAKSAAGIGSSAGGIGAAASLGATGLLAGGFIGGQFLGGSSKTGKLLGGVGGALGLGAVGASGLFGSGIAAALPALLSNPVTAIVAAGLIGGALLFRYFGNRDFKKFQKEVESAYQVKVKGDKEGKGLFEQVKQIGEAAFGKGGFKKQMAQAIRLEEAKKLIAAYGESTEQTNSELVKRMVAQRDIGDEGNALNRFTKRFAGGSLLAGQPSIVGDGGRSEVFVPKSNGYVFASLGEFEKKMYEQFAQSLGGIFGGIRVKLLDQLGSSRQSAPDSTTINADGGRMEQLMRGVAIGLQSVAEQMGRWDTFDSDAAVSRSISNNLNILSDNLPVALSGNAGAKQQMQQTLGIA